MLRQLNAVIATCLLVIVNAVNGQDNAQPLDKDLILQSVVSVTSYDKDGNVLFRGTGFFINVTGTILTTKRLRPDGAISTEVITKDGKKSAMPLMLHKNKEADLEMFVVYKPQSEAKPLKIITSVPEVNERVVVVSANADAEPTMTEGTVSAIQDLPAGKMIQVAASLPPGAEGSPVINMKGEVVGVAVVSSEGEHSFMAHAGDSLVNFKQSDATRPVLLNSPTPRYTDKARRNDVQGSILARALVGADGKVKQVKITRGLPDGLDEEAIKAAFKMKFKPATRGGQPVSYWTSVIIEFKLRYRN